MTAPAAPHQDLPTHDHVGSLPPALARRLRPGRPRRAAAVLLLLAAAAGFVAWLVLGRLLGGGAGAGQDLVLAAPLLVVVALHLAAVAALLRPEPARA